MLLYVKTKNVLRSCISRQITPNNKVSFLNYLGDYMHRIKTILIALAIIAIAAISFKSIVMATEVTRINKNRGLIVINGNKDDGFVMGAKVCFYSSSGEEITCGRIQQTSESYVTVKINNREAKQIRNGMEARLSAEITDKEEAAGGQGCVDDSECGDNSYCDNGECIKSKEKKGCVDDSECGEGGYCVGGECKETKKW